MYFQTLDDKENCVSIYDGKNLVKEIPENISKTWSYSAFLKDHPNDIQYASLYCGGKTLLEVCPEDILEDWKAINDKLKAFYNSFKEAKVSLRENCFYDLVPERFLLEYCYFKNKITEHVLTNYQKPANYDLLKELTQLITDIKFQDLPLNLDNLEEDDRKDFLEKIQNKKSYINYDIFGSITGRMSLKKESFPILNLNKTYRSVIQPKNHWLIELDMNGAELRTAFALLGRGQVVGDHHEWSSKEIFNSQLNRTEAKNVAISWLYNSSSKLAQEYDASLSKFYNKQYLKDKYYKNGLVYTPFGRTIESDDYHAINHLIQSTLIDLFHTQVIKINKILQGKKTNIMFLIHDCVVIDLHEDEKDLIKDLVEVLSDTSYGKFLVNIKAGRNYGDMKKLKLKV